MQSGSSRSTQRPLATSAASTASSRRPPSSLSQRPSSSASIRPPSSTSSARPTSSLSTRPTSRISQRPASRISSARPGAAKHSQRNLLPLSQALVTQITGLNPTDKDDDENFRTAVDFVSKNLEYTTKAGVSQDMRAMDRHLHGHVQKARINSHDALAEALQTSYQQLKRHVQDSKNNDLDQEIKLSHLPDHLQLMILLSQSPTPSTHTYASLYLSNLYNPHTTPTLTWKDILAEEPFEGQHWEGAYGLPSGSTVEDWGMRSGGSTPSLSPVDDDDDDDDDDESDDLLSSESINLDKSEASPVCSTKTVGARNKANDHRHQHRADVEILQSRQYWRREWHTDAVLTRAFNLGDASTLGPSLHRALALGERTALAIDIPINERYINEHDAVREVLMALQGRNNFLMAWSAPRHPDNGADANEESFAFMPLPTAPRLVHLTLSSQASIIASFAKTATVLQHLRMFVSAVYRKASELPSNTSAHLSTTRQRWHSRTLEAFAHAVDGEIQIFDTWCASKEEEICRAHGGIGSALTVSLLNLEKSLGDAFGASFSVVLDVLRTVMDQISRTSSPSFRLLHACIPPAAVTALLLDTLLQAVQESLSMMDVTTANMLIRVFAMTAEPVWSMVCRWLTHGMPICDPATMRSECRNSMLDDEFFIDDNEVLLLDPDFWSDGYVLREGTTEGTKTKMSEEGHDGPKTVPTFLAHVAVDVLSSGKATGLLRALGVPPAPDISGPNRSFSDLLASRTTHLNPQHGKVTNAASLSTDTLSRVVYDELLPHCRATGVQLTSVLVDDCDLWRHLSAIEDLYLMRRGDSMSHFTDLLFAKMDSQQPWSDFHFLNSAFGDVLDAGKIKWIESSLVRLSYRGNKDRAINRTVKSIDGLLIEYAVPFPLTYVFGPRVLQGYSSLFVFLLQIRRAKSVLERILVRSAIPNLPHLGNELKVIYAMRGKLSWFINTLLNFLTTFVIHTQVLKFHGAFRAATSLDEMIKLHDDHLEKIQSRCLLQSNTSSLHRAIVSVLDICLHFSDFFVAFAGDTTTHDISRQSITVRRHRSHRQRQQQKNIIAFSQSLQNTEHTSGEDSDLDEKHNADLDNTAEPSHSTGASMSHSEGGFVNHIDKMAAELDGLVRFIRRGTESLAGGTGEAAPAFEVLAFALEDWDS